MFSDPLVITVNSVAQSMNNIVRGNLTSQYRTADGLYLFDITHRLTKPGGVARVNTTVHFEHRKPKEENPQDFHSIHGRFILDRPESLSSTLGWTDSEIDKFIGGLAAFLGTTANVTKLTSLQS